MYKVYQNVNEMNNNRINLQSFPIHVHDNIMFPSEQDKAESYVCFFARTSCSENLQGWEQLSIDTEFSIAKILIW